MFKALTSVLLETIIDLLEGVFTTLNLKKFLFRASKFSLGRVNILTPVWISAFQIGGEQRSDGQSYSRVERRSANGKSTNFHHYLQALSRRACVNRDIWPGLCSKLKIVRWQITDDGKTQKGLN